MAVQYTALPAMFFPFHVQNEGFSNGIWNSIINHYLPQSQYIVMPEFRLTAGRRGLRPDLLVKDFTNEYRLVYEGKKNGGGLASWNALYNQAMSYMEAILEPGDRSKVALVTRGPVCRFLKMDLNNHNAAVQIAPAPHGAGHWVVTGVMAPVDWHVNNPADMARIHESMLLVANNVLP